MILGDFPLLDNGNGTEVFFWYVGNDSEFFSNEPNPTITTEMVEVTYRLVVCDLLNGLDCEAVTTVIPWIETDLLYRIANSGQDFEPFDDLTQLSICLEYEFKVENNNGYDLKYQVVNANEPSLVLIEGNGNSFTYKFDEESELGLWSLKFWCDANTNDVPDEDETTIERNKLIKRYPDWISFSEAPDALTHYGYDDWVLKSPNPTILVQGGAALSPELKTDEVWKMIPIQNPIGDPIQISLTNLSLEPLDFGVLNGASLIDNNTPLVATQLIYLEPEVNIQPNVESSITISYQDCPLPVAKMKYQTYDPKERRICLFKVFNELFPYFDQPLAQIDITNTGALSNLINDITIKSNLFIDYQYYNDCDSNFDINGNGLVDYSVPEDNEVHVDTPEMVALLSSCEDGFNVAISEGCDCVGYLLPSDNNLNGVTIYGNKILLFYNNRPLEEVVRTLVHEFMHEEYEMIHTLQDPGHSCSNDNPPQENGMDYENVMDYCDGKKMRKYQWDFIQSKP